MIAVVVAGFLFFGIPALAMLPLRARVQIRVNGFKLAARLKASFAGIMLPGALLDIGLDRDDLLRASFGKWSCALTRERIVQLIRQGGPIPDKIAIDHLRAHTALEVLRVSVRVGAGDACLTAYIAGALRAALTPVYRAAAALPGLGYVDVHPEFGVGVFEASAVCIFSLRPAHLMIAYIKHLLVRREG